MSSSLSESGSTSAWRRLRAAVLAEEPLCHWCHTTAATVVDHVVSRKHGGDDRRENLVGSCEPCNLARGAGPTHTERAPW